MKIKNMKLLLIITILFTFSACEIIDEIDKCEEVTKITADASMGV